MPANSQFLVCQVSNGACKSIYLREIVSHNLVIWVDESVENPDPSSMHGNLIISLKSLGPDYQKNKSRVLDKNLACDTTFITT